MSDPEKIDAELEVTVGEVAPASYTSATFNAEDADITIRSSDGVLFYLHRKYLEAGTGAFHLPDLQTNDEVVDLSEPEAVLDILFQFVYPRRHPRLEKKKFELLLAVTEAVEKYEVFSAMYVCEVRLIETIPNHAIDVLVHGLRHDNTNLINDSALMICRRPLAEVTNKLPLEYVLSWIWYYEDWNRVFIMSPKEFSTPSIAQSVSLCRQYNREPSLRQKMARHGEISICGICYLFLSQWMKELEEKPSLEALNSALELQKPTIKMGLDEERRCCGACTASACLHMGHLAQEVKKAIKSIPPFTHYLSTR